MIEGQYLQSKVDQLYPGALMFEAMRVWQLPDSKKDKLEEICASGDYFGQIKKDGNFYQYVVSAENKPYLFSRTESVTTGLLTEKIENIPHIREALKILPPHTIVIGEIYIPGKTTNEVRTIMGCGAAKAVKRQEEQGYVKFYIHDIIYFQGISLIQKGAWNRYQFLKTVFEKLELGKSEHIELAESFEDNLYVRIANALDAGEEGMVLKKKDYPYMPGKKPAWSMIKCKQVDYADAICIGYEPPTKEYDGTELETWQYWEERLESIDCGEFNWGKLQGSYYKAHIHNPHIYRPITKPYFYGWCGSILIGAYNESNELKKIGSVSSGLTDELKKQMAQTPEKFIGQVCRIQMMHKFENAFRHGIFKGFRDDKNPKECTIESIFNEE